MATKSKENILDFFLSGHLKLSHYDYRFMAGLKTIIAAKGKVTSNQSLLFDSLLTKYKKQLSKSFPNVEDLIKLEWEVPVVPTTSEHTRAYVTYEDGNLRLKVPFNKKFINFMGSPNMWTSKFGSTGFVSQIKWEPATKTYVAAYNTVTLKFLSKVLPDFFSGVSYCETLKKALDRLAEYENCIWAPTLKEAAGRLYVAASNSMLDEAMTGIRLEKDVHTLYAMSKFGVEISPEIYAGSKKLKFAALDTLTVNQDELQALIDVLKELGQTKVVISTRMKQTNTFVTEMMTANEMVFKTVPTYLSEIAYEEGYTVYITDNPRHKLKGVVKNITLVNPL